MLTQIVSGVVAFGDIWTIDKKASKCDLIKSPKSYSQFNNKIVKSMDNNTLFNKRVLSISPPQSPITKNINK